MPVFVRDVRSHYGVHMPVVKGRIQILSVYSQEQLDAIADEINGRPRKGLGVRSPLVVYRTNKGSRIRGRSE